MNRTMMNKLPCRGFSLGLAVLALIWTIVAACAVIALAFASAAQAAEPGGGGLRADRLLCEALADPLAVDAQPPSLSWIVVSDRRGVKQSAWQALVASTPERLAEGKADLWDSGKVAGDQTRIAYGGTPLKSLQQCHWKVRVWDGHGTPSAWSALATWTMGLLERSDWQGQWIGSNEFPAPAAKRPYTINAPWLRRTFTLEQTPTRALLHVAALGYHEVYVNGQRVGAPALSPAETAPSKRVLYVAHDVTTLLRPGRNCLAIWLAVGPQAAINSVAKPAVLAQLTALDRGRPVSIIATDDTWKTHPSTVAHHFELNHYAAEHYDATADLSGWNLPEFDDGGWPAAAIVPVRSSVNLSAENLPPNRVTEEFPAAAVAEVSPGVFEVDMGRCFTGWVRLPMQGERGRKVELRFYDLPRTKKNRQSYNQNDRVVLSGGPDVFEHRFVYRAFRWIDIEGLDTPPKPEQITGRVVHTDYPRRGSFACSNDLLTWIGDTMAWTFRALSVSGFVADCSHREKKGYGANGELAMELGVTRFDLEAMNRKWMRDWRDVQKADGNLPASAPRIHSDGWPLWASAVVKLGSLHYEEYGDPSVIQEHYPSVARFLTWVGEQRRDGLIRDHKKPTPQMSLLGDWASAIPGTDGLMLDSLRWEALRKSGVAYGKFAIAENAPVRYPIEEREVFNNAYLIDILEQGAGLAAVVGKTEDATRFRAIAAEMRQALHREYYDPQTHAYVLAEQPYLVLPLVANVPPPDVRPQVEAALEHNILGPRQGHNFSGVLGTYHLFRYLTQQERHDLIYTMLTQKTYPSFGFMREQGATAIWEYWMMHRSQIHSSYTNISWLTDGLAGLRRDPRHPGWRHAVVKPAVVGDVTWVKCVRDTWRGEFVSNWRITNGTLTMEVTVPANATATVHVPTPEPGAVREGGGPAAKAEGVRKVDARVGEAVIEIGSGSYIFTAPAPAALKTQPAK